jgi:hypothetical protein
MSGGAPWDVPQRPATQRVDGHWRVRAMGFCCLANAVRCACMCGAAVVVVPGRGVCVWPVRPLTIFHVSSLFDASA